MKFAREKIIRALVSALLSACCVSHAADAWPSKPIRIVVPFAPGSTGDASFRMIQPLLEKSLNANFYVENRSGASGNIGAEAVARAPADGYTFLLGAANNFVTNQFLIKGMRFDPLADLTPVVMLNMAPTLMIANAALPAANLSELNAYARAQPGKLNYGSSGTGTSQHLAGFLYAQQAGIGMTHVPYRGSAPAVQALLANDVQLYFAGAGLASVSGALSSGKVKILAVGGANRLSALPNVPTAMEQGMADLAPGNWWALAAPIGTDTSTITRLADAVRAAVATPGIQKQITDLGLSVVPDSPSTLVHRLRSEAAAWKKTIEGAKITPE
jgi:tripartite-type tricarboxylate transporter receptor subunit TctC